MKHELTIGFVSQFSPEDKQACSGTNHAIAKSLGKIGNVVWCPLTMPPLYRPACLIAKLLCRTFGKTLLPEYTTWGAKWLSKGFDYNNASKCDVLFFSFCGSRIMNMKRINQPSLYLSDATLVSMIGYYDYFSHMPAFNVKQDVEIEKGSLDCCDQLIFSSDWAARSAINDLGQSPKKVNVIEFGANLDENDIRPKNFGCKQNLNILFMGVDWIRKGGAKRLMQCVGSMNMA